MKVLHTFEKITNVHLSPYEQQDARRKLNLQFFNDEDCNVFDPATKTYVAKYPEKETQEIKDAHHNCGMGYNFTVKVDLMEDGSLRLRKK